MLKQIDVVYGNESGQQALALPILGLTPKDSLLIRKVTGLNPPDKDLFIGDYARDGGIYQGRRVPPRNVVLTLDINPNYANGETVSGLRELLYQIFNDPSVDADYSQLILREDDGRVRYVVGYVDKFEGDLFEIETLAQISLICPDPFIRDVTETSLTNPTGWLTVPFAYTGTAETGFATTIYVNNATSTVTLSNNGKTMVLTYPFLPGDLIYLNTTPGSRELTLTRGGVVLPLITALSPLSLWLQLHSAANAMTVYGTDVSSRPAAIRSLTYTSAYWGV